MRKGLTILTSLVLSTGLALPTAVLAEPSAETVVATVNGENITVGNMIVAYASLPPQYKQIPPEQLYDAILDQLIQQVVLEQTHGDDVPLHVALTLENQRRSMLAGEEVDDIAETAVSEDDIKAAYDEKYADGFGGEEFNAAHILVETKEEAEALKAELDKGADFAATAKEKSTGPSGPNGGDLGWFGLGAMVPEFEQAVVGMEPGQISDPIQTQFGWHLIKLNDKRRAKAPELEEVHEEIANELRRTAVQARIDELTAAAKVDRPAVDGLDPSVLTKLDLIQE
ncbi:peptidylprolyl isomerase [Albibacillus kandeliae]|uniref:peptidylprolyl isomerase n=1 Tax=Albibacillus kandeliae TaxID=2174228 RepID=UPI000D69E5ED|nr:peptidylprolyl isomerase [Albibacillus kandeliae]